MRKTAIIIALMILALMILGSRVGVGQESFLLPSDTLDLRYLVRELSDLDGMEMIPSHIKVIIQENHTFVEDTLIVSLKKSQDQERAIKALAAISNSKDTTSLMITYYAKEREPLAHASMHYIYSSKLYDFGGQGCFQTNWAAYILESENSIEVYPDKATTTIPLLYGCMHGDVSKMHSIYRPYRAFLDSSQIVIKGSISEWECQSGVTLGLTKHGVKLISSNDWERCDHEEN